MPDTDPFAVPKDTEPLVVAEPNTAEPSTGEPNAGEPATEQPDTEQTVAEQPDTEQPDTEQPDTEQSDAVAEEPAPPAVADDVLLASVDVARAALLEITPESTVGAPAGHIVEGERLLSLLFESNMLGYPDWYWTVSLARADDDSAPTVLEAELMPGDGALLAPDWVPWSERLAEYQASQEAARAAESKAESDDAASDDEDDDIDDVDSDDVDDVDDGDIDGVDIDALHERTDDDDYDSDEEFESDDITGVELATLELQEDESDDSDGDSGDGGPEHPDRISTGQHADEEAEDDEAGNP
jgi:hypothetical protein